MCGIAGSTDDPEGEAVRAMCAMLRHRGPDDEGVHSDSASGVSIGIRRLSIMDVEGGHQPLSNEDGSVWVAFNGEIYNHRQLRADLQARGHRFATTSDTEVLVHLYEEYGDELVHALDGMFALALWDERRGRLLLARDRFGEKPLFLHERQGGLLFASELTALLEVAPHLRELEPAAIDAFFVFAYVPGPGTIVRGVRQLAPGHLCSWDRDSGIVSERRWWSVAEQGVRPHESIEPLVAEARRLFDESVRTRMIADVPVGVFLSGGVDSTMVAVAAAEQSAERLQTFTVGYDVGSVNETLQARRTAGYLGSEHHEVTLTEADVGERAPRLLAAIDQPLADRALAAAERAVGVRPPPRDRGARRRGRRRAVRRLPPLPLARAIAAPAGVVARRRGILARRRCSAASPEPGAARRRLRDWRRPRCSSATSTG